MTAGILTRDEARREAARLQSAVAIAPQSDIGRTEIIDTLLRHCANGAHAAATITFVLSNVRDIKNLPAEIVAAAYVTRQPETPPPGCERCSLGTAADTGEPVWAPFISFDRAGCSFATRCSCKRGQWLAEQARRRAAASAPLQPAALVRPSQLDFKAIASSDDDEA